ncbi:MAG: flippase [Patescibacteria group bacterium]
MPNKILKNTLWLSGGEIIGRLLRAVVVIYAARVLGAATWGTLSYVLSLAGLFIIATDIGIGAVLTRELVKQPQQQYRYVSTSFYIKIILIATSAIVMILLTPHLANIEVSPAIIWLITIMMALNSLELLAIAIARAQEKMHLEALAKMVSQITIVTLGIWALIKYQTAESLAAVYAIGAAASLIFIIWALRQWLKRIFTYFDCQLVKKILSASWPFAIAGLLGGTMLNIDVVMLGWFRDATQIGYYAAAQKLIFVLYVIPTLVAIPVFPSLARLANKDQTEFTRLLVRSLKIVLIAAIPIAIGGIITGSEVVRLTFGAEYIATATTFKILLLTLLVNYPVIIVSNALFAYRKHNEFVKYSILGVSSNIILNLVFIPYWGIEGAAISTVITQLASSAFIWKKLKQTNHFSLHHQLNKVIVTNLIVGAFVWLLHYYQVNFFAILAAAIISYPVLLYLLKEELIYESRYLRRWLNS